jgi:hypothetical protein
MAAKRHLRQIIITTTTINKCTENEGPLMQQVAVLDIINSFISNIDGLCGKEQHCGVLLFGQQGIGES